MVWSTVGAIAVCPDDHFSTQQLRKGGPHLERFFAFNGYASGFCTAWFSHVFGFGINYGNRSGVSGFGMPGGNSCRNSNRCAVRFFPVRMPQDDVTAREGMYVKPEVVRGRDAQAEQVVVGVRFSCKGFKAVGKFISPILGLGGLGFHRAGFVPVRCLEYTENADFDSLNQGFSVSLAADLKKECHDTC